AELLTPSAERVRGEARVSRGRATVGGRTLPVSEIVELRFSDRPFAGTVDQGLVLATGDVLSGVTLSLQAGKLVFRSDSLGDLELAAVKVKAIVLAPQGLAGLEASAAGEPGARLTNGDFAAGSTAWINDRFVGVNTGRRTIRLPRSRTALVRFGGGSEAAASSKEPKQFVRLVNGELLVGEVRSLTSGGLVIATGFAGEVTLPAKAVHSLWSEGGRLVPLGSPGPVEVKQTPQFDEHFPHRADRSLAGGFLSIAGRRYERGIGCHSRCELEYELGGRFSSLVAEIGVDDTAQGRGEVVFRVLVDGKVAFASDPVRGGAPARTIHVSLERARRMKLVADFGPGGVSLGDHADWCRATLVR
ncbi:MAG: NPCBM/NEW2 domain-containing protein, partial [Planctomycetota bacterium]